MTGALGCKCVWGDPVVKKNKNALMDEVLCANPEFIRRETKFLTNVQDGKNTAALSYSPDGKKLALARKSD